MSPYLIGTLLSPCRLSDSLLGAGYHLKFNFQLKPPHVVSPPGMYSNVSSLITSIIGHTTDFLQVDALRSDDLIADKQ